MKFDYDYHTITEKYQYNHTLFTVEFFKEIKLFTSIERKLVYSYITDKYDSEENLIFNALFDWYKKYHDSKKISQPEDDGMGDLK